MIYSDNTYDITTNIATYTRQDFKSVFDTTSNKWYMLNNLNNYEEYGIYGDSFDTYYTGKLVIVNGHEYEWNGTEWVDLGEYVEKVVAVYRDSSHKGNIKFPQYIRNMSSFSATFKFTQSGGGVFLGSNGSSDSNDWRTFFHQSEIYYDCGDGRTNTGQIKINNTYNLLFSGNPMKLTNITTGAVIYTGSTTRPSSGDYNFYFGAADEYSSGGGSSTDYGYLYDLVLYSDNKGQNAIAHYIPYIQNGTVGMYDKINDVFVAATGTLGAESGMVRPKDYQEKAAPTISALYASTIYRNSAHLTTLMRNDAENVKMDYMSDDILNKCGQANNEIWYTSSDGNIVTPNNTPSLPTIVSNTYVGGKGVIKCASDITRIGDLAFKGCTTLTSVTIPNSVTRIGEFAFESCGGLTSVIIPNNVTSIGKLAFYKCTGLTFVSIPNKVTSIGNSAFYGCTGLTSVTIPDSVESIGNDAFRNCTGLTSVSIPNKVTSIGNGAFQNCNKLTDVSIGNSVKSIREVTFNNCDSLASVIIGNSVKSIENFAFGYCRSLRNISYEDTITRWNAISKEERWNNGVPATVVHCTDGDAPI